MLSLLLGLAAVAEAGPAKPGWALDGAGSRCTLSRSADGRTLLLRTYPGTGSYDLMLVAPALGNHFEGRRARPFSLVFAPAGVTFHRAGTPIALQGNLGTAAAFNGLQHDLLDAMAKASALGLDIDRTEVASFPLPTADKAVAALTYCEQTKLQEWGADPAGFAPGATAAKPVGNPAAWLTWKDLGKAAKGKDGFAVLRLSVAVDGRIANCTPIESNNSAFDTLACPALASRARYEPARDGAGHPVVSVVVYIASWPCPDCTTVDAIG